MKLDNGALLILTALLPACSGVTPQPFVCASPPPMPSGYVSVPERHRVEGQFYVQLKPGTLAAAAIRSSAQTLQAQYRLRAVRPLANTRAFTARADVASAKALAKHPEVQYVKPATRVAKYAVPLGIDRINQRNRPLDGNGDPGSYGAGVHFWGIDTGIDCEHAEFEDADGQSRCGAGHSPIGGDPRDDGNGHGTHTASTAAGRTFGVLRQAVIHPCKFLDAGGTGTDADGVECIDHMTTYSKENGHLKVVSNSSWGGTDSRPVNDAVCRAISASIVFVAAAGNDNLNACNYSPSRVGEALTVGATHPQTDHASTFSNTGKCIDLFAPGEEILGAFPGSGSGELAGTSMAAPHVAGVAGLCLEAADASGPDPVDCVLKRATAGVVSGGVDSPNLLACTLEP